jgi:hypothetical protein
VPREIKSRNVMLVLLDLLGGFLLGLYALIIGPLGVLRGPLALERTLQYLWVLCPQGLLARSVRAAIDWRFGHFDAATGHLEALVAECETWYRQNPVAWARRRVLEDLFTVLARAYLHGGHIDDAMLVVIRAKKALGVERLPGLAELDAKTAHLVRAGLAAGRLLDGGGLATLFVKSSEGPKAAAGPQLPSARRDGPQLRGAPTGASRVGQAPRNGEAKIIPFPLLPQQPPSPQPPPLQ